MAAAVVSGVLFTCWWMVAYMCVPLLLKLIAAVLHIRREGLKQRTLLAEQGALDIVDIFEVLDPNHFALIHGPAPVVQQFFRHYGHPIRNGRGDRLREVMAIACIYAFVLYFPAGLVTTLWISEKIQYLWLGYQLYSVLAMHVMRILGWQGCGRTEERVANLLCAGKEVWLESRGGASIVASYTKTDYSSFRDYKSEVQGILRAKEQGAHGLSR
jgi:hypothetical protein